MKLKAIWAGMLGAAIGLGLPSSGWGEPIPTSTPLSVVTATNTGTATATLTPWPTSTPIVAPTWAPMSAGPVPEAMKPKKPSPFMSSAGLGICFPRSSQMQTAYSAGFDADLGSGLKINENLSLWLDFNIALYNSKNNALTNNSDFTLIEGVFWAKYRVLDSDISPYFLFGPGLAYNEYRSNLGAIIDYDTGYGYIPINAYEFDFLAEGGLGIDMRIGGGVTTFLQGKLTYDFTSAHFASYGTTDSPIVAMPFELGMIFGI